MNITYHTPELKNCSEYLHVINGDWHIWPWWTIRTSEVKTFTYKFGFSVTFDTAQMQVTRDTNHISQLVWCDVCLCAILSWALYWAQCTKATANHSIFIPTLVHSFCNLLQCSIYTVMIMFFCYDRWGMAIMLVVLCDLNDTCLSTKFGNFFDLYDASKKKIGSKQPMHRYWAFHRNLLFYFEITGYI